MNRLVVFVSTGFGCGYSPYLPGTLASVVAAAFAYYYQLNILQVIILCLLGIIICDKGEQYFAQKDSPRIVFDEFCGMFIASIYFTKVEEFLLAFVLFRFFDMLKPYPINRLQKLPGGIGIMVDDIVAGLVARILTGLIL